MEATGTINLIALSIIGGTFAFYTGFLVLLFRRQDAMNKDIIKILKVHEDSIDHVDDRADILDRAVSNIADKNFNSKLVVERQRDEPTFERIRAFMTSKHKVPHGPTN